MRMRGISDVDHPPFRTNVMPSGSGERFRWVLAGARRGPDPLFDVPLIETADAVVLPTKGSIVPGWVLIVPRETHLNWRCLPEATRHRLASLRDTIAATLRKAFEGHIFAFEHGPAAYGRTTGCGVDQAHLHVAALRFDLCGALLQADPSQADALSIDQDWHSVHPDKDYWYVHDLQNGRSVLSYPKEPTSQGLRRLIAESVGVDEEWDYRIHQYAQNAMETRKAFLRVC